MSRGRGLVPYLFLLPGGAWLVAFFAIPMAFMLIVSLQEGSLSTGYELTWNFAIYPAVIAESSEQITRSVTYALATTLLTLVIGYPMAYTIAFRGGRLKNALLLIVILPFFVSFIIRTLNWKMILADNGIVLGTLKDIGLLDQGFHLIATPAGVIGGLTYNFLPFMVLPLYVALERIDPSLVEAAHDLFASRASAFRRVVFPLSLPGVFAGVLITFVPVASDFVNSGILGGTQTTMIGNVIQTVYLTNNDYPLASAMSFMLMAALLIGIFAYARVLGTEQVMEVSQA
ncbi:MAG: ABC transporter permease [Candidatus Limnocylindria bacterium]